MRSPLPRIFLTRLETGRLVLYSLFIGGLVGLLGSGWRLVLDAALNLSAGLLGYRPPGTAGEGGLLMAFGDGLPTLLLLLPLVAALMAWLNSSGRDPLDSVVSGYHARGEWQGAPAGLRTLLGLLLGTGSGLLIGRDSSFTALGSLAATLLSRLARLDAAERRTLTLASVAAALGVALHAPLAAAVLMAEVLYRRFEFEFEVVMPCVLSAVSASAAYGLIWGFDPLFALPGPFSLNLVQLPLA
ncbi:MAG: chloride channel protein, partial [Deinococcus sp.]